MGRKHVCNNGEAAHVFASQRAAASDIICLILIEPSPQLNQFYWLSWKATKPKMEKTQCNSILTYILFTAESIFMHECFMCAS